MATAVIHPKVQNTEHQTDPFRDYTEMNKKFFCRVHEFYIKQHANQTVDFVKRQRERFSRLDKV
jgi:hypothetical protein